MNKRKILIVAGLAAVIGTGAVYAGGKHCHRGQEGMGFSGHHQGHNMHRLVNKMDHHLDLSDEQRSTIEEILGDNRSTVTNSKLDHRQIRAKALLLDPLADTYEQDVSVLADEVAAMARERMLSHAELVRQVATVLTPAQREQAKEMIQQKMDRHMGGDHS